MPSVDVELTETVADVVKFVGWRTMLAVSPELKEMTSVTGDTRGLVETWSEQDAVSAVAGAHIR